MAAPAGRKVAGLPLLHTLRMGSNTVRYIEPPQPATYWRRRLIALAAGMSVLALAAWAFAGALRGSDSAAGTGGGGPGRGAAQGAVAGQSAAAGAASHGTAASASTRAGRQHAATAADNRVRRTCQAADVVLSLFSSQTSYTVRETPEFEVDVVSTASKSCLFDIGSGHVILRITEGATRVWTSADCAEGESSLVTELQRGVPTVVPIGWDGQYSSPGCPVPGAQAGAGSYTAVASDGSTVSNALAFTFG
jgi:hypothetical protein